MMKLTLTRTICAGSLALGLSIAPLGAGTRPPNEHPEPVGEKAPTPTQPFNLNEPMTPDALGPGSGTTKQDALKPIGESPSPTQGTTAAPLAHQDVQFLQQLSEHQMSNLILGLMMIERADSDALREHGRTLVDQSVKTSKALMELAGKKGIFIAVDQLKLPTEELTTLSEKAGKAFDSAAILALLHGGTKLQGEVRQSVRGLSDPQIRSEAEELLSRLDKALTKVRDLASSIGVEAPAPVGEPPLPEKDASPTATPQDHPPKGGGGEEGGAVRPFDNPPGF